VLRLLRRTASASSGRRQSSSRYRLAANGWRGCRSTSSVTRTSRSGLLVIAITLVVFGRLPHESAYLIPLYPFGFFVMAKYFSRVVLAGAVAAIVLAGFVDIGTNGATSTRNRCATRVSARGSSCPTATRCGRSSRSPANSQSSTSPTTAWSASATCTPNSPCCIGPVHDRHPGERQEFDQPAQRQGQSGGCGASQGVRLAARLGRLRQVPKAGVYVPVYAGRPAAALPLCTSTGPHSNGAKLIDLGRNPSGGSGGARTDR